MLQCEVAPLVIEKPIDEAAFARACASLDFPRAAFSH
jgi:hypothetical protein